MMIPKTIHYCWFGRGKKCDAIMDCIESWKKYMPQCEIIEWNEDNYDIRSCPYCYEAYESQRWAFVSDYARIDILFNMGGLYLDTDMKLLKGFDFALESDAFVSLANPEVISMGLLGFAPGNDMLRQMLSIYKSEHFLLAGGKENHTTIVTRFSNLCKVFGLGSEDSFQVLDNGLVVYPTEYFYPTDYMGTRSNYTAKTCAVHLHNGSWLTQQAKLRLRVNKMKLKIKKHLNLFKSGRVRL